MSEIATLKVWRGEDQAAGRWESFEVPFERGQSVLDGLRWIRANRDTTAKLARALVKTLAWMQTHTPEDITRNTPNAFRNDDALYVEAVANSMPMFSPDGVMDPAGANAVHTLLAQSMEKVRNARIDLSQTYTNEFVHGR